jgi:hypothetical protein
MQIGVWAGITSMRRHLRRPEDLGRRAHTHYPTLDLGRVSRRIKRKRKTYLISAFFCR